MKTINVLGTDVGKADVREIAEWLGLVPEKNQKPQRTPKVNAPAVETPTEAPVPKNSKLGRNRSGRNKQGRRSL